LEYISIPGIDSVGVKTVSISSAVNPFATAKIKIGSVIRDNAEDNR
jgi:hypothetical protein